MSTLAVVRRSVVIPKRDLLLFDAIFVPNLDHQLERLGGANLADAEFLIEQGVLREPEVPITVSSGVEAKLPPTIRMPHGGRRIAPIMAVGDYSFVLDVANNGPISSHIEIVPPQGYLPVGAERFIAATISQGMGPTGYCTYAVDEGDNRSLGFGGDLQVRSRTAPSPRRRWFSDVEGIDLSGSWRGQEEAEAAGEWQLFEAVIDAMPVPSSIEPLDAILSFKQEAQERSRLERLGRWIQLALLKDDRSPKEVRLEMEDLLLAYETEMRAQRIAVQHEKVRILVALPSALFRAIIGSASKDQLDFLTLREHKVKLAQAEMNANGRELAYISSARDRFKR